MLLLVTLFGALALAVAEPQHNVFVTDLEPEVAAQYLKNLPFTEPQLAPRTNVLPLIKYNDPRFRSAEAGPTLGHYWKNGKEIENPDDYVEEVYNARQYHGQDGLGAYAYGYETPESSKAEAGSRAGDVQGSYTYKAGSSNNLIKVRYWADSQGFHQEDNIPKYVPKPVEEAPEVKAARLAHEKAWQEAAYANLHPGAAAAASQPQPQYNYNQNYQQQPNNYQQQPYNYQQQSYDYQGGASGQYNAYSLPPSQLRRTRQAQYDQYQGQYNQGQNQYNQYPGQDFSTTTTTTTPAPDPTGPPRGFFYSFDYPVSIIVEKKSQNQDPSYGSGYPIDNDSFAQGQKK